jgi:hypothetical protein
MLQSKLLCTLLALTGLATSSRADLILEYRHTGLTEGTQTFSIQDSKCRADFEGGMLAGLSVIMSPGNDTVYLHHPTKALFRVSAQAMQNTLENSPAAPHLKKILASKPVPTGETETVAGYDAENYTLKSDLTDATLWVTNKFPHIDEAKAALQGLATLTGGYSSSIHSLPEMIVRLESNSFGIKQTQQPVSTKETPRQPGPLRNSQRLSTSRLPRGDHGRQRSNSGCLTSNAEVL